VSFFDDEPDEPTRVTRPARPRRSAAPAGAAHRPDPEIARRRQFVLFGGLAIIAIILIFTVKSCSSTRHKNALKDYNRDVASIVQSSDDQVSKPLFDVLQGGGGQTQDVRVAVNQVRLVAEEDAKRARALNAPDDVAAAQHDLELTMNLRAAGVTKIGDLLPRALSNQPSAAESIRRIAGQMQSFLASDVVYSQRTAPLIREALDDNGIGGQTIATSRFLPNIGWLDAAQVGARINPDAGAGSTPGTGEVKAGTHGHGVISVKSGTTTLVPGTVVNRLPATAPVPLEITYANQGENDESNVTITAKVTGGPKAITATKRINQTKAGTTATTTLELRSVPPKGSSTMLTVTIKPVAGEKKTDNNTQTYTVLFN
jgi:hypothetical protein